MKAILFNIALIFLVQLSFAQIHGKVIKADGQPVPFANVALLRSDDTSVIRRALTNNYGAYQINGAAPGRYVLRVGSVGYQTYSSMLIEVANNNKDREIETIVLKEDAKQLNSVVVRAEKPLYQQKAEGLMVNVESSLMSKGSSALEVLERSPGVVIDHHNNTIALNGKSGVTVMLDGKLLRMSLEELLILLNSMSADDIATIELLTTPSAKYDAEGTAGIINITLKKNSRRGTSGAASVTGGYGWGEKATANVNVAHNTSKLGVYGSYTFSHDRSYTYLIGKGQEIVPVLGSGLTYFDYLGINKPVNDNHNARGGIDLKLTPKTTVGGMVSYNSSNGTSVSNNRTAYTTPPDSFLLFNGVIHNISHWRNVTTTVYAEKAISAGEKISFDIDYLYYNISNPTDVASNFVNKAGDVVGTNNDSLFSPSLRGVSETNIKIGVAKLDYSKQLSKKVKLETGLKGTYTRSASASGIESLVNGAWAGSSQTANDLVTTEGIAAAYASANLQINQSASVTVGGRYEYYDNRANDAKTGASTFNRTLGQIFPSVFFSKKLNDNSDLQFSYTKRISRPSYNDLASFITYNDPVSVFTGNPLLKPTITNNIKLGYNYRSYTFSLLASRDDNPIAQGQLVSSPSGNIVYISPQNVTYQNNLTFQTNLPFKVGTWWNMAYGFVGGWRQFRLDYTLQPVVKTYFGYSANFTETFKLPIDYSVELSGNYNSVSYYGSSKVEGIGALNAGIKKELKNNKGALQLSATDLLRGTNYKSYIGAVTQEAFYTKAYISWFAESTKFPIIKLTYTRVFGNNKLKTANRQDSGGEEKDRVK